MNNTTKHVSYLKNKTGRIYTARSGRIIVFCLNNGERWFIENSANVIHKGPVDQYWIHSIDFAGGFAEYFTYQMVYDEINREHYPGAEPIVPLTAVQIEKLKK